MESDRLFDVMREQPFLKGFSVDQIAKLTALAHEVRFAADEIIFQEGGESEYFYLLLRGSAALEVRAPGRMLRIQTLGAGDEMGWSSMLADMRAQFHARALTEVEGIAFPSSRMLEVCRDDPALGYELMRGLLEIAAGRLKAVQTQFLAVDSQAVAMGKA